MVKEFIQDPARMIPMKCNSCGRIFKAIGLQEGRTCRAPLNTGDPNQPHGNRCNGSLFEITEDLSEGYKRQSDARHNKS
jgi:hypothetical protein